MSKKILKLSLRNNKPGLNVKAFIIIAGILAVCLLLSWAPNKEQRYINVGSKDLVCLEIENSCKVYLEVADDYSEQLKGLSDRTSMSDQRGMLFVFNEPGLECFWMKDMLFDIDMVWLDKDKKVAKINKNVSASSYPENYCQDNVKYVIELNSGKSEKLGLKIGQKLSF